MLLPELNFFLIFSGTGGSGGVSLGGSVWLYLEKPGVQSGISSCDLQHWSTISASALGPGDIISHVSIYTVYPGGFQELYFLRLPGGAIIEVCIYENI